MTRAGDGSDVALVFRRQIRLLPLVALIYFSVSGGPFSLEESISSSGAGMTMVLIIVIPVIFAVPCSLMNAELGSALPLEGGYYAWVKIGLGKFWGFMEGMISWVSSWLDTALYPVIFVDYLATWFPELQRGRHVMFSLWDGTFSLDAHWFAAIAFMVPLAYLNARGSRLVGDTSVGLLIVLLIPFVVLVFLGFNHWFTTPGVEPLQPFTADGLSPRQAAGAGLAIMIWNYIGFDSVSTAGGEIDNPRRTYPLALLISVPLIMVTYLLPVLAALASGLHAGDATAWTDGDFAEAGALLGGSWLQSAIVISAMVAQVGLFSSLLLSGSRVPAVLAADHYLPKPLARINPRTGTPITSIVVSCGIFAVFVGLDFATLIDADVILLLLAIVLEFAALIALRHRFPLMRRPFTVPFGWVGAYGIAVVPTLMVIWLLKSTRVTEPGAFWIGVAMVTVSAALYPVLSRWAKRGRPDAGLDLTGVDFGPGIDAEAVVRGGWVRGKGGG